jgi:putative CRISPR-associated protein (TIGR02619 family)
MHELLATDTALGRLAAEIIREYLVSNGLTASIYAPAQLSTANPSRFSRGIKTLIKWCEKTIPGYRRSGYRVIFNLTGGFKSLQGYLNIVGMFYADRLVYIFEGSQELLTVPRLPIRVAHEALHEHRVPLAMMAQGDLIPRKRISAIPGGLLETDAGLATLSDWGLLIWTRARDELLGDEPLDFPRLAYSARFRKAFDRATPSQRVALQETLAKVAGLLEDSEGDVTPLRQDSGLQYENYSSVRTHDGRPIAHFRLTRGRRVSCTPEPGGILLRTFGEHDIVNGKP